MLRMDIMINLDLQKRLNYNLRKRKLMHQKIKEAYAIADLKTFEGRYAYGKAGEEVVLEILQNTRSNKGVWSVNNDDVPYACDLKYVKNDGTISLFEVKTILPSSEKNFGCCNPNCPANFRVSTPLYTLKKSGKISEVYSLKYLEDEKFSGMFVYYPVSNRLFYVDRELLEDIKRIQEGKKPLNKGVSDYTSSKGHKYMTFKPNLVLELVDGRCVNYT